MEIWKYYRQKFINVLFGEKKVYDLESLSKKVYTFKARFNNIEKDIYFEQKNLENIPESLPNKLLKNRIWGDRSRSVVLRELSKPVKLNESKIFILENVVIVRDSLYVKNCSFRHVLGNRRIADFFDFHDPVKKEKAALSHCVFSVGFWGHWLMNELPMQMYLDPFGELIAGTVRQNYRDEAFWRQAVGLPKMATEKKWLVNELVLSNPLVFEPLILKSWFKIRQTLNCDRSRNRKLYLKRGMSGAKRSLVNEEELISRLEQDGFEIVDISTTPASVFINLLLEAEVVIGVEGSHMDPVMYCLSSSSLLVVLQPPGRVSLNTVTNSSVCGVCPSIFICVPGQDFFTFAVDADKFFAFLDRASIWMRRRVNIRFEHTCILEDELEKFV